MADTKLNICCIIDFDGFHVDKLGFLTREFGFIGMHDENPRSHRYNLTKFWSKTSEKSKKTIFFCKKNIHGMSFRPMPSEIVKSYSNFEKDVKDFYLECCSTRKCAVGFKGGHVERDLLQKLRIPYINLEEYQVPKFDILNRDGKYNDFNCGYHQNLYHCPKAEVMAFRDCLRDIIVLQ